LLACTDGGKDSDTGPIDQDADGFFAAMDCDDSNAEIYPGAQEVCDGVDNDCDGEADDSGVVDGQTWYADADGDDFGDADASVYACSAPEGYISDGTDCDDSDGAVNPSAVEVCDIGGVDEDCDGAANDLDVEGAEGQQLYYDDVDGDSYGDEDDAGSWLCEASDGYAVDNSDCNDINGTVYPGADEICDSLDHDCNGESYEFAVCWAGATAVETDGTPASEAISMPVNRDFFSFDTVAGYIYILFVDGGTEGSPDTVLRLYNQAGDLIGENDDMPYRLFGTDSGFILRGQADETVLVEVLEWSDWTEGEEALGGANFTYDLIVTGSKLIELNEDDTENDIDNDTLAQAVAAHDRIATEGLGYSWYLDPWADVLLFSPGELGDAGDVDTLVSSFADAQVCQWSFYPGVDTELSARLSLYNEDYELVAQTTDADITPEHNFLYDAGITYPVSTGNYYLQIEDTEGGSGPGHWYPALSFCYSADVATYDAEDFSNDPLLGTTVDMYESLVTPDYWYGRLLGFFEEGDDAVDYFILDEGVDGGDYLSVSIEVAGAGSLLSDPVVTVLASDGATVLASVSGEANPLIKDLEVPAEGGPLYVSIESETGLSGTSAYYLGLAWAHSEPTWE